MQKLLFSLFTLTIIVGFTSCGISAVDFNDKLVDSQKAVIADYDRLTSSIEQDSIDIVAVKLQGDSILARIDDEISKIKAIEAPKNGEDFKASAIAAFEAYRKIIEVEIKGISFNEESNPDEYNAYVEEYTKVTEEGATAEDNFLSKQKEYAKANNVQLR